MPKGVETETGKQEYRTGEMQQKLEALGRDPIADMARSPRMKTNAQVKRDVLLMIVSTAAVTYSAFFEVRLEAFRNASASE